MMPAVPDDRVIPRRAVLVGLAATTAVSACSAPAQGPPPSASATTSAPAPTATSTSPASPATPSGLSGPSPLATAGPDITSGSRSTPAVALTFHGQGDLAITRRVLDICAAHQAGISVFAVGQWLEASPGIGRAIIDAGHDLGNHTWSHPSLTQLSAAQVADEIAQGADAVRRVRGGDPGLLFRPSGTPHSTELIRAAATRSGYARTISYDVDPEDYRDPGASAVVDRTLAAVRPGSIVSLHLGHQGTADALSPILDGLRAKGLQAWTVTALLQHA